MAVIDRDGAVLGAVQQTPQGCDRLLGSGQAGLETRQVVGDHPVAGLDVRSLKHDLDVIERHLQIAETADDLCLDDLLCGIAPVPAVHVHLDRLQQADLVIVAKHLHAQVRGPGEVADGHRRVHQPSLTLPRRRVKQKLRS